MPGLRTYKLFISHSWSYNDDYYRLVDYLNDAPNFDWKNLSVPEHDPVSDADLRRQLRKQIQPASVPSCEPHAIVATVSGPIK